MKIASIYPNSEVNIFPTPASHLVIIGTDTFKKFSANCKHSTNCYWGSVKRKCKPFGLFYFLVISLLVLSKLILGNGCNCNDTFTKNKKTKRKETGCQ